MKIMKIHGNYEKWRDFCGEKYIWQAVQLETYFSYRTQKIHSNLCLRVIFLSRGVIFFTKKYFDIISAWWRMKCIPISI